MGLTEIRTALKVDLKKPAAEQPGLHNRWHPDIPFNGTIKNGEVVKIECVDWTGGQIGNNDSADDVKNVDLTRVHYLSGPFEVETAEPGDVLVVEIQDVQPFQDQPWGFTGVFDKSNGGGFLDDIYPHAAKAIWDFEGIFCSSRHIPGVRFPGLIHPGILGCAPSAEILSEWNRRESELISTSTLERIVAQPPEPQNVHAGSAADDVKAKVGKEGARTIPGRPEHGGNCDIKNLSRGSNTYLPVLVKGAKFSVGDLHFSQGDGEISFCGAIEMAGIITVKLTVMKNGMTDLGMKSPMFIPGPVEPSFGPGRYLTFEGFSVDENGKQHYLDATVAYRQTTLRCIEYLRRYGYSDYQVYLMLSCAPIQGHIAGLVDIPNACTTLGLPMDIFDFDISPSAAPKKMDLGTYKLDKDTISKDLTADRPLYILSAYGPGRDAPQQLFGGQVREQSFEELRLRHYEIAFAGNEAQAIQEAQTLYNNAESQIQTTLSDIDGAIKYIVDAANQHPNRLDICRAKGVERPQREQPFGGLVPGIGASSTPSDPARLAFGQPSVPAPAFGQPAFGQAATTAPAFGQPSSLGQKPSAFGQAPNPQPSSAFGQAAVPSPFVQPQQTMNPFGVQNPQQQSTFGQPSNISGQQAPTGSHASSTFGQKPSSDSIHPFTTVPNTSKAAQSVTASANPFGQAARPQSSSGFGQPARSQLGPSPLGMKPSTPNQGVFGQPPQTSAPIFGQASAPVSTGAFGTPSIPMSSTTSTLAPGLKASSRPPEPPNAFNNTVKRAPTNATFGPGNPGSRKLLSWQGQNVTYVDNEPCIKNPGDGGWQKIWFPEGPQQFTSKTQEYPDGYVLDETARKDFEYFIQHGIGANGLIPEMPPPRDMISWDF
ncbi:MAG: hypothetical protein Q9220_002025 [cf. Caloplaca sp. 1 TL-2023]